MEMGLIKFFGCLLVCECKKIYELLEYIYLKYVINDVLNIVR